MSRLAAADLAATTNTSVYTVPSGKRAAFTVSLCNRTAVSKTIRLALQSGSLTNADYIEFDASLPPNGVLERSGVVLAASQILVAYASATGVSCVVYGIEETA